MTLAIAFESVLKLVSFLAVGGFVVWGLWGGFGPLFSAAADAPELALLMGELQRMTHKLALSADAGNVELAAFYLHESLEQLQKIQKETPEYEGVPVALLVDRMGLPAYDGIQRAVLERPASRERLLAAVDNVITGCNVCHAAAQHGFIRITHGTGVNPFNQSFSP
ncbi:MAG: hypothetical protein HC841_04125 [Verrucomicrobiae bacterium]|nr:hypothetical protein [Verrucomicrobiae bacterium]